MTWAPDYCTTAEAKAYLRIGDTVDDTEIALAVTAASRAIDRATGRQFGATATTEERTYPARYDKRESEYRVEVDDLMTTTGLVVTVSGETVDSADYTLYPLNAAVKGRPWTGIGLSTAPATVLVEATWGWTSVPDPIKQACLLQTARLVKRREAPFGVAGSPDMGSELRLLAKVDPDVQVVLGPYRRWWGAAS